MGGSIVSHHQVIGFFNPARQKIEHIHRFQLKFQLKIVPTQLEKSAGLFRKSRVQPREPGIAR